MKKFTAPLRLPVANTDKLSPKSPAQRPASSKASGSVSQQSPPRRLPVPVMIPRSAPSTSTGTPEAFTAGASKQRKNTARKSIPKLSVQIINEPKKPTASLTDLQYDRIFYKVLNPSPGMPQTSAGDEPVDDLATNKNANDITESDIEDLTTEVSPTGIDGSMRIDQGNESIPKKTPGKKPEARQTTSLSTKSIASLTDLQYDRIFHKVLNPSPATPQPSAGDEPVDDLATNKNANDITESDLEDLTFEVSPTGIDGSMRIDQGNESIPKKTPGKKPEARQTTSMSTGRRRGKETGAYRINIVSSTLTKSMNKTPIAPLQSHSLTESDIDDLNFNPKRAFLGFPKEISTGEPTKASTSRPLPSRRLRLDVSAESSEEWNPPEFNEEEDTTSTPVDARAPKRSLDYDETPVTRFPRKRSAGTKETVDEDKENVPSQFTTTGTTAEKFSPGSTTHATVSDVRPPLSNKSNSSYGSISNGPAIRELPELRRPGIDPQSSGFPPSSAKANWKPTENNDELMPPPSSSGVHPSSDATSPPLYSSQTSTYSLPSSQLNTEQKMEWLLPRRMVGTWVQCNSCNKWRYHKDKHDPTYFPLKWCCRLSPDLERNSCDYEEETITSKEGALMIHNNYAPGSVVWAKVNGHPWWPAVVDDDPDYFQFYWFDANATEIPTQYHVVFFGKEPSRAWVKVDEIRPFKQRKSVTAVKNIQLRAATREAESTIAMTQEERLRKFGMLARFKGKFGALAARRDAQRAPSESSLSVPPPPASGDDDYSLPDY